MCSGHSEKTKKKTFYETRGLLDSKETVNELRREFLFEDTSEVEKLRKYKLVIINYPIGSHRLVKRDKWLSK
jgi:hypothetical protein